MAEISCWFQFFHLSISNFWMVLISEPLVRFGWVTPHWKFIMLLFSNIMRLNNFHVIFSLMSAVLHRFKEKYVMWHHWILFEVTQLDFQKKIGNVQSMLEQNWLIFVLIRLFLSKLWQSNKKKYFLNNH